MALDLFTDSWASWQPSPQPPGAAAVISSPRISFSCDLDSPDEDQRCHHRSDSLLAVDGSPSSSEFDFCVARDRTEQDSSAADELFSDGVLLPLCLLYKGGSTPANPARPVTLPNCTTTTRTATATTTTTTTRTTTVGSKSGGGGGRSDSPVKCVFVPATLKAPNKKEKQKEPVAVPGKSGAVDDSPAVGKLPSSFWRFRRSSSLNSGCSGEGAAAAGSRRSSLICSFPLLSRSKSAGSNPITPPAKPRQQHHQSTTVTTAPANATTSSSKLSRKGSGNGGSGKRNPYYYGQQHHGGAGGRISPVLNVPSPYIPKGSSSGILSLGHLLCSVKDKRRNKTQFPPSP